MILSFYGDGKGKTTAALGIALRSSGYGKKILLAQFIKGTWKTGEDDALRKIPKLEHKKFGLGFVGIPGDKTPFADHQKAAQGGLDYVKKNVDRFDLIILDEIFGAVKARLLIEQDVVDLIGLIKPNTHLVMTGRPKISGLLALSDLISEIRNIKHPFDEGKLAEEGIDY